MNPIGLCHAARALLAVSILALHACATTDTDSSGENVIVEEGGVTGTDQTVVSQTAPAISNLLDQSTSAVNAGQLDEGARVLERALRIEPANPEIWYRMAQIKFLQSDYSQAAVTALRSNTFVGNNASLRALNLSLMYESYMALGDTEQAKRIRDQIEDIQRP